MSADLLRRAATRARDDWPTGPLCPDLCSCNDVGTYHPGAEVHQAVADWLDDQARYWDAVDAAPAYMEGDPASVVARAYLGES